MSVELVLTTANLFAVLGYAIRLEGRLSALEAKVEALKERLK